MLTVESYSAGGNDVTAVPATRVLIRDAKGNPICLAVSYDDGGNGDMALVAHLDDPDFVSLLRTFGISDGPRTLTRIQV